MASQNCFLGQMLKEDLNRNIFIQREEEEQFLKEERAVHFQKQEGKWWNSIEGMIHIVF